MRKERIFCIALLIAAAIPCRTAAAADEKSEPALDITAIEGKWKVVSATWGGEPNDYVGAVYDIRIEKDTAATVSADMFLYSVETTQFIAAITREDESSSSQNPKYCAQRYARLPNSFQFYLGYPALGFWDLKDYPCGPGEPGFMGGRSDEGIVIDNNRYLIRLDLESAEKAHAVIYYEGGAYMVAEEKNKAEVTDPDFAQRCENGICWWGATGWTGIFELELEKVK